MGLDVDRVLLTQLHKRQLCLFHSGCFCCNHLIVSLSERTKTNVRWVNGSCLMTRWTVWVTILHASFLTAIFPGKSGLASCALEVNSLGAKFYDQTWHQPISPFLHPLTHVSGLRWLSHASTRVWVTVLPVMCWLQLPVSFNLNLIPLQFLRPSTSIQLLITGH